MKESGALMVSSSNDWSPTTTPRNSWLGGFKMNGEEMSTLHMLQYHLKKGFKLVDVADVPRLTRQHHRKYELDILETSAWARVPSVAPAGAAAPDATPCECP